MNTRRKFLGALSALGLGAGLSPFTKHIAVAKKTPTPYKKGLVVSTWWHGLAANDAAMNVIKNGGMAVDAAEVGVRVTEADESGRSVGIGGLPDRDGNVTLDACIMDHTGNAGGVCFLQNIMHPISVARKVMDGTPHVLLAGEGAYQFAKSQGFKDTNLLTAEAKKDWEEWKKTSEYKPIINRENHDTIGLICMDQNGNLSGACTTSGLAYKMHGRVGDSPIIGAGLFVDNEVGAATATGMGEAVLKTLGSFLIVELMRQGMSPQEACEEGVRRISLQPGHKDIQIGYLAISKSGEVGAYSLHPGFNYAQYRGKKNQIVDCKSLYS
ncbi:MAG: N(4)-(beta-N-acetylglucosaminyl)-L-asparaginase [Flavobacteriales bacterium]|nr:N(4)-(beta-N-acetylglucosaminyl)-L-asparaginase [Flavobacteriales bacterium]